LIGISFFPDPLEKINLVIDNPLILLLILKKTYLLLYIVFVILLELFLMPFQWKKIYRSDKSASKEKYFKITEETISVTTENGNLAYNKEKINKIWFEKDRIYIFLSVVQVITIKKIYFENEKDYEEIKRFIYDHYKNGQTTYNEAVGLINSPEKTGRKLVILSIFWLFSFKFYG
jgi:hypothetical protein